MSTSETQQKKQAKTSVGSVDLSFGHMAAVSNETVLQKHFLPGQQTPWATETITLGAGGVMDVLPPPASLFQADEVIDNCPSLAKNIACMVTNVAGHGFSLRPRIEIKEDMADGTWQGMLKEKQRLESFFDNLCIDYSFSEVMELLVTHLERYANAYWEILRAPDGRVVGISPIENPKKMRLCAKDKKAAPFRHRSRVGTNYESINTERRFRRFVMLGEMGKKRYFRQYGDARQLNSETGEYGNFETVPRDKRANEILHFRLPHSNSEYGVVRWISALVDAMIARVAKVCNLDVLDNGGTPPMAIAISGSTDKTLESRIREQIEAIKSNGARSKVLIIQVEAEEAGVQASETVINPEIEFHNLAQMMISEGMFLDQLRYSDKEICAVYRISPLLLGDLEQVPNKSTAEVAKGLAEEQVFAPARKKINEAINRLLMDAIIPDRLERGVMYWDFALNSLNADKTEEKLSVAKEGREAGSLTLNQHHSIISNLLPDEKLEALPDDSRNDTPMIYLKPAGGQPGLQELSGAGADKAIQSLSKAFNREITKIMMFDPNYDNSNPYSSAAA